MYVCAMPVGQAVTATRTGPPESQAAWWAACDGVGLPAAASARGWALGGLAAVPRRPAPG